MQQNFNPQKTEKSMTKRKKHYQEPCIDMHDMEPADGIAASLSTELTGDDPITDDDEILLRDFSSDSFDIHSLIK